MIDFLTQAQTLSEFLVATRRDFHRHPELGFQEVRTAGIVARQLRELGLEVTTGIGKTGVVALLEGTRPGPVVLLRFDMDALPIMEETGAEYASENRGVMHACGHDGHTTIGLAVARLLSEQRASLPGTLKLVFQPAEEGLGGAKAIVEEGVLENPHVDRCLALHLWNSKPVGWVSVTPGAVMSAAESFEVHITGKGGHGASPELCVDPVLASAHIITTLQSIVARNIDPLKSAVVSVTAMHSGEVFNVIPPVAHLKGTIRTFDPQVRSTVLERFNQVASSVGQALGCQVESDIRSLMPAVSNDAVLSEKVKAVAERLFPNKPVDTSERTMGSEDMAFMMDKTPGCYFFIGSANAEKGLDAGHHHPRFDFDEEALPRAAALMAAAAVELLGK